MPDNNNTETKLNGELSFEAAAARLEAIVRALEDTSTSLDDSLKLYSEGIELVKLCNERLDYAQQKITILKSTDISE